MANLTIREHQVLQLVADGQSDKEIGSRLGISFHTVQTHKKHISEKTGVRGQVALMKYVTQMKSPGQKIEPLAGYWLSHFDFESHVPNHDQGEGRYRMGAQINLERVDETADGYFTHEGSFVCGARPESLLVYQHEFRFRVTQNIAVGVWENNNSRNVGCFQLFVRNDGQAMHGCHLGNTSNGVVKTGNWLWIRAKTPSRSFNPDPSKFRNFEELESIVETVRATGRALVLAELFH